MALTASLNGLDLRNKRGLTFNKAFGQRPRLLKSFLNALLPLEVPDNNSPFSLENQVDRWPMQGWEKLFIASTDG